MTEIKLEASAREGGKPNLIRRQGRVPAVVYGHRRDSQAISVDEAALHQILGYGSNALIKLTTGNAEDTVMVKEIQRDPVRGGILHIDFLSVALDEVLTARVPLILIGEEDVSETGGIVQHQLREVEVECLPTDVPGHLNVNVSDLRVGDHISAGDLTLPVKVTLITDPDEIVVTVVAPRVAEVEEAPEEEEEVGEAPTTVEPPK